MKYYIELTLIPNDEIPLHFLWEKLYQQLHLALVENLIIKEIKKNIKGEEIEKKISKVGVSFPKYNKEKCYLCNKLRLLALEKEYLEALNLDKYFARLTDYVHQTCIKEIPVDKITGYAFFKREQVKSNNERLARRRANKKGISNELALNFFTKKMEVKSKAPFIYIKSQSNGKRYPLFILMEEASIKSESAEFSSYGLSSISSVPIF
ncbi:hypothetical protein AU255_03225 [Methyloprofundus sedimenti]|uniref:Uncharacterized protein n=1 Tax=Methyloprofundus sedimenti TaxID=1420851 RepID=A0A1V8M5V5_9GAMM|nr:type I-F CRISPR-associated endoribonuclease Cas6/Csy4 [Methyloprofundus sedimenti]OQK16927.1 hypothetical protein AU255_03225 [Methyloprofundus sedimenti]